MSRRRHAALVLLVAAAGCTTSIPNTAPPETIAYAISFPDCSDGTQALSPPLPNDLVLQAVTSPPTPPACSPAATPPSAAQVALLQAFASSGGWPNDQEVPIQVQLVAVKVDPSGGASTPAPFPDLDLSTIVPPGGDRPATLAVVRYDGAAPAPVDVEIGGYDRASGVLALRKKADPVSGARWWPTGPGGGRYAVALRGGDKGVKTSSGQPIAAQASALLIAQDKDLTLTENQGLLRTAADPAAAAARLEQIRQLYASPVRWTFANGRWVPVPGTGTSAFAAIDSVFPHADLASVQTFVVDPSPHVAVDPNAGIVPLPSELLMTAEYYQSPAGGKLDPSALTAFGSAAAGLATLDGFSTTAMILAPTTVPVLASTVTKDTVLLYELNGGAWTRLPDLTAGPATARYVTEPPALTQTVGGTAVATAIGLQPAVPVGVNAQGAPESDPAQASAHVTIPPLKGGTRYAVVITSDVKDATGQGLTSGTLAKILGIVNGNPAASPPVPGLPIVDGGGHSLLAGVSDATAQQLTALAPAVAAELATGLPGVAPAVYGAPGVDPAKVALAYTFRTQTLTGTLALAAIPDGLDAACGAPCTSPVAPVTISEGANLAAVYAKYGIDLGGASPLPDPTAPTAHVKAILETQVVAFDLLDPATGAFRADLADLGDPVKGPAIAADILTNHTVPLNLLLVLPAAPSGGKVTAPLVVFRHGLGRSRVDALLVAEALTARGFAVAAIDAAKHGDRALCNVAASAANPNAECAQDSVCVPGTAAPGDPAGKGPGQCRLASDPSQPGHLQNKPVACLSDATCQAALAQNRGIPVASGEFVFSGNFFRTRDTFRQGVVDGAQLVNILQNTTPGNPLADAYAIAGPNVFIAGQSWGGIESVLNGAANAKFVRVGTNATAGDLVDAFTNATDPVYQATVDGIFLGLGIDRTILRNPPAPGTPQYATYVATASAYLKVVNAVKWMIDPADPVNYAAGVGPKLLGQIPMCDDTLPNPFEALLYGNAGLTLPTASGTVPVAPAGAPDGFVQWFVEPGAAAAACPAGRVPHGFVWSYGLVSGQPPLFKAVPEPDQAAIASLTAKAQADLADFLLTGAAKPARVTP